MMHEHPIFDEKIVKRFEYNIDITKYLDGQPSKTIDKLIIHPIEVGNKLEFTSQIETDRSFSVPIKDVIAINIPQPAKGALKKEMMLLEMQFYDSHENQNSIAFNVLDVYVQEILGQVKACKSVEEEYWDTVDLQYILDGKTKTTQLYYKTPFLSEGEELLWINTKIEGIANKRIRWLEALTNFRAIYYDFLKHDSGRIPLIFVDDVIVKNQRTSGSDKTGIFVGTGMRVSHDSGMIGDVHFMKDGMSTVSFLQVSDPYELADVAKIVIEKLFASVKPKKKTQLPMMEGPVIEVKTTESGEPICPYCGAVNQVSLRFCNSCGYALQ
jgi:hypothetical protein